MSKDGFGPLNLSPFVILHRAFAFSFSERLSAGESGVNVVPPLDAVALAQLPAEQHDAPVAQGGKVYQPALVIFELHAERLKLACARSQREERGDIAATARHPASAKLRAFGGVPGRFPLRDDACVGRLNAFQDVAHVRQQRVRFFDAVPLATPMKSVGAIAVSLAVS
jgi:hypothetical protein